MGVPDQSGARAGHEDLRAGAGRRAGTAEGTSPVHERTAGLRGHLDLAGENGGFTPWCGPAALALATGRNYRAAGALLRSLAPAWYPEDGEIVTAYWRDLLAGLEADGIPYEPLDLPEQRPSLLRLVRDGLPPGWYLVRVTDHFLLLRSHGFGLAQLHDNRHTGALVTARTHGRRKVTHLVRLLGGPLVEATRQAEAA